MTGNNILSTNLYLFLLESNTLTTLAKNILEALENKNDLTPEQFEYWKNTGVQINDLASVIIQLGKQFAIEYDLNKKAESAHLN